jgi:rare lipoprotein A
MGTRFNPHGLSAAHRTLPLPTRVRVTNLSNRRSIVLVVNDRGPFVGGRLIDLSLGAAKALRLSGLGHVEVEALD